MEKINLTSQRKAILDIVQHSEDHPTAADIIERLRDKGQHLAYGTVYNSLRYLSDTGLIRELKLGEASSRYDARTDDHHHIICKRCGRVDEVLTETPIQWVKQVEQETSYLIEDSQVVFEGVCAACQAASK
ncbi:Fur family transcriptional regulator [Paenibacillus hexagrammi]|uniref:Transcriptional repressor n=1 Tax=Paenibacillus hexagrammi TaxID=2908839 RepID=A0ABY3SIP7_9BACL|nr:transcriptional repressor [Paenibacillus sp. YPD9-1]UJF33914.1 transcriptional repressor [Paenibacillus sp. YPD9-1]